MRWLPLLPASLWVTTVVLSVNSSPSIAQSQVAEIAQSTTIFIQAAGRPDVFGSGVIVARSGNTYTALVAKHVVALEDSYKVTTSDKAQHVVKQLDRLGNIDIAVVQFDSKNNYAVAAVGAPARQLDQLIVSGYPKPTTSVTSIALTLVPATVNTILDAKEAAEGFSLRYSATLRRGMSGGPVFNSSGELVAIHGRADELGGLGIPLPTFIEQAKAGGLKVRLGGSPPVAVAPPPPRPPAPEPRPTIAANPGSGGGAPSTTPSAPVSGGPTRLSAADVSRLRDTKQCPGCSLDGANLSFASLFGANLANASLRTSIMNGSTLTAAILNSANLSGANLSRADLGGAQLRQAVLSNSDLSWATLSSARMQGAQLTGANLTGAKLMGADLTGANLNGANLSGANLNGAILDGANLDGANLDGVIGYSGRKK
jgi:hypothetical protein